MGFKSFYKTIVTTRRIRNKQVLSQSDMLHFVLLIYLKNYVGISLFLTFIILKINKTRREANFGQPKLLYPYSSFPWENCMYRAFRFLEK